MAIGTENREMALTELSQALSIHRTARSITERVQLETCLARADPFEVVCEEQQQLGVCQRIVAAEHLGPDLVELPVPTALRTLPSEHRADVEEPGLRIGVPEAALEIGARDGGGRLGAQRERGPVAIGEAVHLFLDDVGRLADRAREELRPLENRQANLAESVDGEHLPRGLLESLPAAALFWEDVPEALDGDDRGGPGHVRGVKGGL